MRIWERRPIGVKCGRCGSKIPIGDPVQFITADARWSVKTTFARCRHCAEGKPPADLPALVSPQVAIEPSPMVRAGKVKLPFDYRLRQSGEREPGSDDE